MNPPRFDPESENLIEEVLGEKFFVSPKNDPDGQAHDARDFIREEQDTREDPDTETGAMCSDTR